tara:strand:- start:352 stop:588 length:237 start_codon:yes stop_codon:yes gene_type:complete
MTYTIIFTDPAPRGKVYYTVRISDDENRTFKLDPDLTQEQIDAVVNEELQIEQQVRDDQDAFNQLIADGLIEDPRFPS